MKTLVSFVSLVGWLILLAVFAGLLAHALLRAALFGWGLLG